MINSKILNNALDIILISNLTHNLHNHTSKAKDCIVSVTHDLCILSSSKVYIKYNMGLIALSRL